MKIVLDILYFIRYNVITKNETQIKRKRGTDHRTRKELPRQNLSKGGTVQCTGENLRFTFSRRRKT